MVQEEIVVKSNVSKERLLTTEHVSQKDEDSERTFGQKLSKIFRSIRVEPAYFLFSVCFGIESVGDTNFWVDKVCDTLYSKEICKDLNSGNYPIEQDKVQQIVTRYQSTYSLMIEFLPAIFVAFILGAWCDAKDRKLVLILPLVGLFLKAIGLILNNHFWTLPPEYILLASVPVGFGGGMFAYVLGYSSYLGASTSKKSRTTRFAFMNMMMLGALPLGKALTAILYARFGYVGVFGCLASLHAFNLIYSLIRLEKQPGIDGKLASSRDTPVQKTSLRKLLSPYHIIGMLSVPFKKRENGRRTQVLGHVIVIIGLLFNLGIINFQYLYTRKKFGWDFYTFTTWSEISTPCSGIGVVLLLPILSYKYKVGDALLGLMGSLSYMYCNLIIGLAPAGWVMYIGIAASILSGMSFVASRGALSKLVSKEELGSIFAVVCLGESLMPIIGGPLFTLIYNATLEVFPGTIFIMTAVVYAIVSFIYAYLYTHPEGQRIIVEEQKD